MPDESGHAIPEAGYFRHLALIHEEILVRNKMKFMRQVRIAPGEAPSVLV